MIIPDFLNRTSFFLNEENYNLISNAKITMCGLGGLGGQAFLNLVRMGFKNFKLAENGIFDPPDMNRQALAFNRTMDKRKIDVYKEYAIDINPDLNIEIFSEGLNKDNLQIILDDIDIFIRVMDFEKSQNVKIECNNLILKSNTPMFQASCFGISSMLYNFNQDSITPDKFWRIFREKNIIEKIETNKFILDRLQEYNISKQFPSTSIGVNITSLFLANEILSYVLRNTKTIEREISYAPTITVIKPLQLKIETINIEE